MYAALWTQTRQGQSAYLGKVGTNGIKRGHKVLNSRLVEKAKPNYWNQFRISKLPGSKRIHTDSNYITEYWNFVFL